MRTTKTRIVRTLVEVEIPDHPSITNKDVTEWHERGEDIHDFFFQDDMDLLNLLLDSKRGPSYKCKDVT